MRANVRVQIVEVGGAGTLPRSLEAVKTGGVISLVGFLAGTDIAIDPLPVLLKSVRLEGVVVGSVTMFERMNQTIEAIRLEPVIDEVFPLARAADALRKMVTAAHFGKIVIRID